MEEKSKSLQGKWSGFQQTATIYIKLIIGMKTSSVTEQRLRSDDNNIPPGR